MDVVVTLTYAPVHGPQDFLKAVEQDASLGQKDRAFQIAQKKTNVLLKKSRKRGIGFVNYGQNFLRSVR